MYLTLFTKAHVPAHNRVLASGKVVRVSAYDDRRPHRRSQARRDGLTRDLFADYLAAAGKKVPTSPVQEAPVAATPAPALVADPLAAPRGYTERPIRDLSANERRTLSETATYRRAPRMAGSDADRNLMETRFQRGLELAGRTEPADLNVHDEQGNHFGLPPLTETPHALSTHKQALDHALSTLRSVGDLSGHFAYPLYEPEAFRLRHAGYPVFHADSGWWIDAVPVLRAVRGAFARNARVHPDQLHTLRLIDRRTPDVWEFDQPPPDTAVEYPLHKALPSVTRVVQVHRSA